MSSTLDKSCGKDEKGIAVQPECLNLPFKLFGMTFSTPISTQDSSDKDSTNGQPSSALGEKGPLLKNSSDADSSQAKNANLGRMETDEGSCSSVKINGSSDHKVSSMMPKKIIKPDYKDKVLPCPRCDSLETKFCYYNNYNVNQPRHFCKNCQRYWTAGGTLRNVPVGAGRRKNKHNIDTHTGDCSTVRNDNINTNGHAHSINSCFPIPIPEIESAFNFSILSFGLENYNSNFSATGTQVLHKTSKPSSTTTHSTCDIGLLKTTQDSKSKEIPLETEGNWRMNINANAKTSTASSSNPCPYVCNNGWSSHHQNILQGSSVLLGKRSRSDQQQNTSTTMLVRRALKVDDSQEAIQTKTLGNLRMQIMSESFKSPGIFKTFQ